MSDLQVMATIPVKAEAVEQVRPALQALVEATRGEEGCLAYDLFESGAAPGTFVTLERWRDADALDAHMRYAPRGGRVRRRRGRAQRRGRDPSAPARGLSAHVCARPRAQQVGHPRSSTAAGTTSRSASGPHHGTITKAATISGRPIAPRARCRGTLLLANIVSGWLTGGVRRRTSAWIVRRHSGGPYSDGSGVSMSTSAQSTFGFTPA